MQKDFKNKTIWIVGASSGIGEALAKNLHINGANLILSARSHDKLEQLNVSLELKHKVLPIDISNKMQIENAIESLSNQNQSIDSILILAAQYEPTPIENLNLNTLQSIIDINLTSVINLTCATLKLFHKQGYGQIVLCGSVAGYVGLANAQPYSATKAAIANFAQSLYLEQKSKNIDVKLLSPGFVKTPMTDKNHFEMPMMISPEQAAQSIADGLNSNQFEIHFPKKFTYIMKFLSFLPYKWYFLIAKKFS